MTPLGRPSSVAPTCVRCNENPLAARPGHPPLRRQPRGLPFSPISPGSRSLSKSSTHAPIMLLHVHENDHMHETAIVSGTHSSCGVV